MFSLTLVAILSTSFTHFAVPVTSDDRHPLQDATLMRRSCSQFSRGVHVDRDPFDPKEGRGASLFEFTYAQGEREHAYADQFDSGIFLNTTLSNTETANPDTFRTFPYPKYIESIWELQKHLNESFIIDFLPSLDRDLGNSSSLGLSGLSFIDKFTYGYTHSKAYKYQRDNMLKGGMTLFKYPYKYNHFQLSLNISSLKLSAEFTADLQGSSKSSIREHASSLIAKYGSLFIKSAIFGVSYTQTEFIPKQIATELLDNENHLTDAFFAGGDLEAGKQLLARFFGERSLPWSRHTLCTHRGGLLPPLELSRLPRNLSARHQKPEMLQLWLAPLSQLITGDLPLKHEVATQVRNSLLRTVARNFLDSGLFPAKYPYNRYVPTPVDAEVFFPGIVKYVERTREQLATFNGSSLGDPKVSPFIKMDAIAKALEFTDTMCLYGAIGLNHSQVEATYTTLVACNRVPSEINPYGHFSAKQLANLHEALLKVAQVGSTFDSGWYGAFTSWSVENDHLKGLAKYTAHFKPLAVALYQIVGPLITLRLDCPQIVLWQCPTEFHS